MNTRLAIWSIVYWFIMFVLTGKGLLRRAILSGKLHVSMLWNREYLTRKTCARPYSCYTTLAQCSTLTMTSCVTMWSSILSGSLTWWHVSCQPRTLLFRYEWPPMFPAFFFFKRIYFLNNCMQCTTITTYMDWKTSVSWHLYKFLSMVELTGYF